MSGGAADGGAEAWEVRPVAGAAARKAYRCPGCDQEIRPGQPHVVAWPPEAPDDRRHWHRVCWDARARRRPRFPRHAPRH